ncbi:substrate-binding domain-containing protein [Paenibacillus sp. LjRoot153]|uniref:substrate-binding domain-containing protein n=1 Tax=Paenibacillus sp. LjRoot153 TaxID=3342270 RepID=UPI003ECE1D7A
MEAVKELIAEKVDLIAISANDPKRLVPVLKQAREQGIKVITWDSDTEASGRDFFVTLLPMSYKWENKGSVSLENGSPLKINEIVSKTYLNG